MPRVFRINRARKSKKVRKCQTCGHEIQPGESYKYADQRVSYPRFGSIRKIWCAIHTPSEYEFIQNPDRLTLLQTQNDLADAFSGEFDEEEARAAFEAASEGIESLADSLREKAENIEQGFGHPTEQSYEFQEKAKTAQLVADELAHSEIPTPPDLEPPAYEPDEPEEPDPEDYEGGDESERYQEDFQEYQSAYNDYEQDQGEYDDLVEQWEEWRDEVRDMADEEISQVEL